MILHRMFCRDRGDVNGNGESGNGNREDTGIVGELLGALMKSDLKLGQNEDFNGTRTYYV